MEKKGKKKQKFKMPKWMDCAWRRGGCNKEDCPICGRINAFRYKCIMEGKDPDTMEAAMEQVGQKFKEVLEKIKEDCESKGIELTNIENIKEPPEPEKFPLYRKIKGWRDSVYFLLENPAFEFCYFTEAGQDLAWYADTLMAKVYRQLCNKWHIENGDEYGEFDFQYTSYVLKECLGILKKSLKELKGNNVYQKKEMSLALSELSGLEKQIKKIKIKNI